MQDLNLAIPAGTAHGLVGESGSGKSMTARAIMRLLPPGAVMHGRVLSTSVPLESDDRDSILHYRSHDLGVIFQDARANVNPVRTIGDYLTEAVRTSGQLSAGAARDRAIRVLESVRVDQPERRIDQYPHELSGGLLQRVMIAGALMTGPRLLLADECTSALDVLIQAQVMAVLDRERRERALAMLFITHDLDLAAAVCDVVSVVYAGQIVEELPAAELAASPGHPYTAGLLASRPTISHVQRQFAIPGRPISGFEAPEVGCVFADRCPYVQPACRREEIPLTSHSGRSVRCRRSSELAPELRDVVKVQAAHNDARPVGSETTPTGSWQN